MSPTIIYEATKKKLTAIMINHPDLLYPVSKSNTRIRSSPKEHMSNSRQPDNSLLNRLYVYLLLLSNGKQTTKRLVLNND